MVSNLNFLDKGCFENIVPIPMIFKNLYAFLRTL